jgi:DedD protein
MGLFSRNKEALEANRGGDVPFDSLSRSPRSNRRPRAPIDGNPDAPPALDPAETAKTRARHRLIGAVVLATAAVVFVPMLFDRTPVATSDDMSLQIPERDTPFEGRRGVPDAAHGPLKASSDLPQTTPVAPPPEPAKSAPVEAPKTAPAPVAKVEVPSKSDEPPVTETAKAPPETSKPVEAKPASNPPEAKVTKAAPAERPPAPTQPAPSDDPKALAALEGKPGGDTSAPAKAPAGGHGFAVQVAAYAQMSMAKSIQDKLTANGLKAYTQSTTAANGNTVIRVRLGPYASHDEADRARAKLKTMKLDGSVVPL